MTTPAGDAAERFVREHTALSAAPLVPELALHLANDVMALWRASEAVLGVTAPPPYWGFAWPGGQALARYVLDHPDEAANRTVLDIGAGSGLVALAAARAGARSAEAADTDSLANAACALNAAANRISLRITRDNRVIGANAWQTVLAGDMCYERPLAEALTAWLAQLAAAGTRVLLGDPGRVYFPRARVTRLAHYVVPTSRDLEDRDTRDTGVYVLSGG